MSWPEFATLSLPWDFIVAPGAVIPVDGDPADLLNGDPYWKRILKDMASEWLATTWDWPT